MIGKIVLSLRWGKSYLTRHLGPSLESFPLFCEENIITINETIICLTPESISITPHSTGHLRIMSPYGEINNAEYREGEKRTHQLSIRLTETSTSKTRSEKGTKLIPDINIKVGEGINRKPRKGKGFRVLTTHIANDQFNGRLTTITIKIVSGSLIITRNPLCTRPEFDSPDPFLVKILTNESERGNGTKMIVYKLLKGFQKPTEPIILGDDPSLQGVLNNFHPASASTEPVSPKLMFKYEWTDYLRMAINPKNTTRR
jgi:hypothetical protein